jgi:hypothetical protein
LVCYDYELKQKQNTNKLKQSKVKKIKRERRKEHQTKSEFSNEVGVGGQAVQLS